MSFYMRARHFTHGEQQQQYYMYYILLLLLLLILLLRLVSGKKEQLFRNKTLPNDVSRIPLLLLLLLLAWLLRYSVSVIYHILGIYG